MRMHHTPCGMLAMVCALTCIATAAREAGAQVSANERQGAPHIPTPPPTHLLLSEGRTLYEAGRYKEAAASFERALQAGVKKPHEAAWEVARAYAMLGNDKQARRWQRIAVQLADGGGRLGGDAARALPSSMPAPPAWRARLTQRRQSSGERDGEEHRPGSTAREEAR